MPISSDPPTIEVAIEYLAEETRTYRGKGQLTDGFVIGDRLQCTAGGGKGPLVTLTLRGLQRFPSMLCDLALEEPEVSDDDTQEEFEARVKTRQELATAFEVAAARLRDAGRRS